MFEYIAVPKDEQYECKSCDGNGKSPIYPKPLLDYIVAGSRSPLQKWNREKRLAGESADQYGEYQRKGSNIYQIKAYIPLETFQARNTWRLLQAPS